MAYPVLSIANKILERAHARQIQVDPLKLQKLTYLAHGWSLAFTGQPYILEGFNAWPYGPVSPPLYHEFREFRANPITRKASAIDVNLSQPDDHILNEIMRVYGGRSGLDLSALTHQEGSAWRSVYDSSSSSRPPIPDYLIKAEFDKRRADGRG